MRELLAVVLVLAACRKPVEDPPAAVTDPQALSAAAAQEAPPAAVVLDPLPDPDETKLAAPWREEQHVADPTPTPSRQAVQVIAAPMEADACSPCSYTDSAGVYHLVDNASEVPAQYRKQAGQIRGSVQRVDALLAPQSGQPVSRAAARSMAPTQPEMTQPQSKSALLEEAQNRPAEPQTPDPNRNSLGEDFIEYNTRLANQAGQGGPNAPPPKFDPKAKCIDNLGASVPCSETGMQAHQ